MIEPKFRHILKDLGEDLNSLQEYCYGWHMKSLGFRPSYNHSLWIRIAEFSAIEVAHAQLKRIKEIQLIKGIDAPLIHTAEVKPMDGKYWLVVTMAHEPSKSISISPVLDPQNKSVNLDLLTKLKQQIINLEQNQTQHVAFRQELISRRIQERYPKQQETVIEDWCVVHGDLHWANISENAVIFDWESYGLGPRGIDIAFLYIFSLLNDAVAEQIKTVFSDYFDLPHFKINLLFVSAELMRMTEVYGDHPDLYQKLQHIH